MSKNYTLITMGCSLTKGVGCWGNRTKKETNWEKLHNDIRNPKNIERFEKYGWPSLVGKELGFDKVINIAQDGASNSGQLKHFMECDLPTKQTYVIWMLTDPIRFSFYSRGTIRDFNPTVPIELTKSYLNTIDNILLDGHKEQLFYINCLREICNNRGYKLILTYWSEGSRYTQSLDENKTNWLFNNPKELFPNDKSMISNVCNHPNELGYEWISKKILKEIRQNHKNFIVDTPNKNMKYESINYKRTTTKSLL